MAVPEKEMRRLAFIKQYFEQGVKQSKKSQPMASTAILTFHDSADMFLQLSGEYLDVSRAGNSGVQFMEYWDILSREFDSDEKLAQKSAMRDLHKARTNLKHSGIRPDEADIEEFRVSTRRFFEDNTELVFGIELSQISLSRLISFEKTRGCIEAAENSLGKEEFGAALEHLAVAYRTLIAEYEERARHTIGHYPFNFGRSMTFHSSFRMKGLDKRENRDLADFIDDVSDSVSEIQDAIRVLSLGVDYRRYSHFQALTPTTGVQNDEGGDREFVAHSSQDEFSDVSRGDVEFCLDFIIETALTLQESPDN